MFSLVKGIKDKQLSASLTSVAFSKAFDFIHCEKLIALYVEQTSLVTLCLTWKNIKGFSVSGVMIVNKIIDFGFQKDSLVCRGQALDAPKCHYNFSVLKMLIYWQPFDLVLCRCHMLKILGFCF